MVSSNTAEQWKRFEIPGRVSLLDGQGELPKIEVKTDWSNAEIYFQGAHVTEFQLRGKPPLLFTSQCSGFVSGQAIRGGVPIIFPWFGARESGPAHGFARIADWELHEAVTVPDGGVSLRFGFPGSALSSTWPPFAANYVVTVTDRLQLELIVTNASSDQELSFENCLHTYFAVRDINAVSVTGLKGARYLDKADNFAQKTEVAEHIKIASEVDRTYLDTTGAVEILDPGYHRKIIIEKSGSASTVVWNPWIAKAQQMADFGNDEYKQMICVESGNIATNKIVLAPGRSSVLRVTLRSIDL